MRSDSHARKDDDVNLGMAEKPKQMLPQNRRSAAARYNLAADHHSGRKKETGACQTIQQQQNRRRRTARETRVAQRSRL